MTDLPGGWDEYRKLVLSELERMSDRLDALSGKIDNMRASEIADVKSEIAVLKFKSGLWGAFAGAIPGAIAVIFVLLQR